MKKKRLLVIPRNGNLHFLGVSEQILCEFIVDNRNRLRRVGEEEKKHQSRSFVSSL